MAHRLRHLVDAHHHLWQIGRFPYGWLAPETPPRPFGDHSAIKCDYLPEHYREDLAELPIRATVHVQTNCGAADPVEETAWLAGLNKAQGLPNAVVAEVDLCAPDAAHQIARHAEYDLLRGVRAFVAWQESGLWRAAGRAGMMGEAAFRRGVAALAAADLCLDLVTAPEQLGEVAELAAAFPGLSIAVNHLGHGDANQPAPWRAGVRALAAHPNVVMKVSGLWTIDRAWAPDRIAPFVDHVLNVMGAERMMWGSNLPVEKVMLTPQAQIAQLMVVLEGQSPINCGRYFCGYGPPILSPNILGSAMKNARRTYCPAGVFIVLAKNVRLSCDCPGVAAGT